MPLRFKCCIYRDPLSMTGSDESPLDPCALTITAHADRDWRDQKVQTFYCHFECFRRLVNDDSAMYIMRPDFSTLGEVEDENSEEENPNR